MSVEDVEGVAQGLVQSRSGVEAEMTDRSAVEQLVRDRDDVVAADDTELGQTLDRTDLDL